jgi:hypothetical protein
MSLRKRSRQKTKNHAQDGRMLSAMRRQHPAILPWFLVLGWRPSFRVSITGTLPVSSSEPDCCWTFLFRRDPSGNHFPLVTDHARGHDGFCLMPFAHHRFRKPNKPALESIMQKRAPNDARVFH